MFDDELSDINNKLSALEATSDLGRSGLPPALSRILEEAMPIYRTHGWIEHDRENHDWISSVQPYVERYGPELSRELARVYQTKWPKQPLRVDVSRYANWAGAYTTLGPIHLTISGIDARNQPPACLEILFHEASHGLIRPVRDALTKELAAQGKSANDLWHALLFFTTGDIVRRHLTGYVPYAYKFGLYDRRWQAYRTALEEHWTPYLEGRASFDSALREVVKAL